MEDTNTEGKISLCIDLPIYQFVRDAQLQHGLKYDDHRQYRSYCSRRIHRIRRSLNTIQGVASSAKARHTRARKLMDISNAMVLEAGEKDQDYALRMIIIPLCLAERAWSYAMQLKQEVSEYPRRRFHLVRRLEKAAEHASRFEKLVHDPDSPCSDLTKQEAIAYSSYMNALYKMERENWAGAKEDFYKSLVLYTTLSLSVKSENFLEQYRLRIEEIRASLRYCTFTLGEKPLVHKVKLPPTLQFHDIAYKHVINMQELEAKQAGPTTTSKDSTKDKKPSSQTAKIAGKSEADLPAKTPVSVDEEDEDEFEETREVMDEDGSEKEDTESDSDDDNDQKQARTGGGGVTGLVKGWLGGAWS